MHSNVIARNMEKHNLPPDGLTKEQFERLTSEAECHRICAMMGVITKDEVIMWADTQLLQFEKPPFSLIEVSAVTHESMQTILGLLRRVGDEFTRKHVASRAFEEVRKRLLEALETHRLSHDEVAERLYQLSMQLDVFLEPAIQEFCSRIDDGFQLVRSGVTFRGDAERALNAFLRENCQVDT